MTLRECIEQIESINTQNKAKTDEEIYDELYDAVVGFDTHLDYFFEDYYKESYVYDAIYDTSNTLEEFFDQLNGIDHFTGVYHVGFCGWETADLTQLKTDILIYLRGRERQLYHTTDEPVVWVEEDDNFLTKEVTE